MNSTKKDKIFKLEKAKTDLDSQIESEKEAIIQRGISFLRISMVITIIIILLAYSILDANPPELTILCLMEIVVLFLTYLRVRYVRNRLDAFNLIVSEDISNKISLLKKDLE